MAYDIPVSAPLYSAFNRTTLPKLTGGQNRGTPNQPYNND